MADFDKDSLAAILSQGCEAYGNESMCELAVLLSMLRATGHVHQAHHWQTRGQQFYGDHLLFDRLYTEVRKSVDPLAERAVGSGDYPLVNAVVSSKQIADMVKLLCSGNGQSPDQYVMTSLKATAATLALLKVVYEALSRKGKLTHGTDNLLQDLSDTLEGHVYLLKQRAKGK